MCYESSRACCARPTPVCMEDEGHARPQAGNLLHNALGVGHAEHLELGRRQVVRPRVEDLHNLRQARWWSDCIKAATRQQACSMCARAHLGTRVYLVAHVADEGLGQVLQQGVQQGRVVQHYLLGGHAVPARVAAGQGCRVVCRLSGLQSTVSSNRVFAQCTHLQSPPAGSAPLRRLRATACTQEAWAS